MIVTVMQALLLNSKEVMFVSKLISLILAVDVFSVVKSSVCPTLLAVRRSKKPLPERVTASLILLHSVSQND